MTKYMKEPLAQYKFIQKKMKFDSQHNGGSGRIVARQTPALCSGELITGWKDSATAIELHWETAEK